MGRSPPKLQRAMERLRENGFRSSPTAFEPTGFRTDAGIGDIEESFG
jgi:tRNA G26 N,N-dimethylase Trm1